MCQKSHLKQLPFVGKKSVPAAIRPDLWTPFCTVTFPSPYQGQLAFRKLRELRRLHETSWHRTDPDKTTTTAKQRMRFIMDQKANAVADLAQVLVLQREQTAVMQANLDDRAKRQRAFLAQKWARLEAEAKLVRDGELERVHADAAGMQRRRARAADAAEKARLDAGLALLTDRHAKLLRASRLVKQRDKAQQSCDRKAAAKQLSRAPENAVKWSLVPAFLKKRLPRPFALDGVSIQWASLYDAEHAKTWPEGILHDVMGVVNRQPLLPGRERTSFPKTEDEVAAAAEESEPVKIKPQVQPKKRFWQRWSMPKLRNPFRLEDGTM